MPFQIYNGFAFPQIEDRQLQSLQVLSNINQITSVFNGFLGNSDFIRYLNDLHLGPQATDPLIGSLEAEFGVS